MPHELSEHAREVTGILKAGFHSRFVDAATGGTETLICAFNFAKQHVLVGSAPGALPEQLVILRRGLISAQPNSD
jgi:hypothetical protein